MPTETQNSSIDHEFREKLYRAIQITPNMALDVFMLLGYRKSIAELLVSGKFSEVAFENAKMTYDQVNNELKKLLAL